MGELIDRCECQAAKMPGMSTWITQTSWIYGDLISSRACGHPVSQAPHNQHATYIASILSNARDARRIADSDGMQVPRGTAKPRPPKIAERLCPSGPALRGPLLRQALRRLSLWA